MHNHIFTLLFAVGCTATGSLPIEGDTGNPEVEDTGNPTDTDDPGDVGLPTEDDDNDGFTEDDGDCDDSQPAINPLATDLVGDTIDQNCDGIDGTDADGDAHASLLSGGDDCDDTDNYTFPGAVEIWYDGKAQGCEVGPDDAWNDGDQDGDGFDSEFVGGTDCIDTNAQAYPEGPEFNGNGLDDNCNGLIDQASFDLTWYAVDPAGSDEDEDDMPDNWTGDEPVFTLTITDLPLHNGLSATLCIRDPQTVGQCGGEAGTIANGDFDLIINTTTLDFTFANNGDGSPNFTWFGMSPAPAVDKTYSLTIGDTCFAWGYDPGYFTGCAQEDPSTW
ncbi:MopE-related protein [Deltaproteobacteria bacterium]|nr:MopE-related protein [Deltaproteobacteria bacterium]